MSNSSEKPDLQLVNKLISHDLEAIQPIRVKKATQLDKVKASPEEAQVAFIKELIKSPDSTNAFLKDPKQYAIDHGILLSPELVKSVSNTILFDVALDSNLTNKLGKNAIKDIIDMREGKPTGVNANLAAVAAGAAVVMAVAAVVTMVVTLVRVSHPADLVSLQNLTNKGITLPNGRAFQARDFRK